MWIILLIIALGIYPIPFLLIFFFKCIIQRKFFSDLSSEDFYKNWNRSERFLKRWVETELIMIGLIAGILFGLAY